MKRLSKALSYYLRHAPQELGLDLQPGGWVEVADLIPRLQAVGLEVGLEDLRQVVAGSDKQRFALDGSRIRANQGHSVPVDLELTPQAPPALLYHGTARPHLEAILIQGLIKGQRHHVHLSLNRETARQVGQRHGPCVLLEVDSQAMDQQGHLFYCSANQVWLTESVPPQFLRVLDFPTH